MRSLKTYMFVLLILFVIIPAYCSDYFVAPNGNDNSSGTIEYPFVTIHKAVSIIAAGDNIFLRGGTHNYSQTIQISSAKSGQADNIITLQAYQSEIPVLDFSTMPTGSEYMGIALNASYWHVKNFIIQYAEHNGLRVLGSYNVMEQLVTRGNGDTGLHLSVGASYNLVLNCDSYFNYDPEEHGQDADGFGAKGPTDDSDSLGPGNVFRGCRAWNNSDDGFDFWHAGNGVTVEDCWAFRNGENIWGDPAFTGNGNGFKLGHGGGAHILKRCVAYDHWHHGIDLNGNISGVTIYNCTCIDSGGSNYFFDEHSSIHVMRNNLSHSGVITVYDGIDDEYNSWNGFSVDSSDFVSLNSAGIDGPREPDGSLPKLAFIRLSPDSVLIDAGVDVGLLFEDGAPDLGAFEYITGDCHCDGDVDMEDLECFVANWLEMNCGICGGANFDNYAGVDFYDFSDMANNWLKY